MNQDFFQDQDMKYIEYGVVLEDFKFTSPGKIYIPVLFPELASNAPMKATSARGSVANIINKDGAKGISTSTISNYIELKVPRYIANHLRNKEGIIKKGTRLYIAFIGGEINKPRVIGAEDYDEWN